MHLQADDLAGMGKGYVMSQTEEYKQMYSHVKVELEDAQWEAVTRIFHQVGEAMKYHGMIDIECEIRFLDCCPAHSTRVYITI